MYNKEKPHVAAKKEKAIMRKTIGQLMADLGVSRYPEHWSDFYDEVMDTYDREGCPYATAAFYERLQSEYAPFGEHLALYCRAAEEVGKNEDLSRLLSLLCHALTKRETATADTDVFLPPTHPDGPCLAYDMLPGLAICSAIPYSVARHRALGIPEEKIAENIKGLERAVNARIQLYGAPGYHLLRWHQYTLDAKLFVLGRLQYELPAAFSAAAAVFSNEKGDVIALADGATVHAGGRILGGFGCRETEGSFKADLTETETAWIGHPYDARGLIGRERITLEKREFRCVLRRGDPVVSVHIPAKGHLSDDAVEESIAMAKDFFVTYFPSFSYRAFVCYSWLMDMQLVDILGEDTNISRFVRRFHTLTMKSEGAGALRFVFHRPDKNFPYSDLPERTTLERKLKELYLSERVIYEAYGYFLP